MAILEARAKPRRWKRTVACVQHQATPEQLKVFQGKASIPAPPPTCIRQTSLFHQLLEPSYNHKQETCYILWAAVAQRVEQVD